MKKAKFESTNSRGKLRRLLGKLKEMDAQRTPTTPDTTGAGEGSAMVGPPAASIVQIYGPGLGRRHILEGRTFIGRDRAASVRVDLPGVSRRHAAFFQRDGAWWVVDLGSTNGTFLSGMEIHEESRLTSGDVLRFGGSIFKYLAGGDIEALYHEEIYRLTITDGLTGIHNKRYFMELLEREAARARRRDRSLWLAMLDIDHFKKLNDSYGHVTGDHLLQQLGQLMASEVRAEESVARYGGEEFIFMFPEAESAEVKHICERIRKLVEEYDFVFDGEHHQLTVSMGASSMLPAQTSEDLIRATDKQLYRAKKKGRNRVMVDILDREEQP